MFVIFDFFFNYTKDFYDMSNINIIILHNIISKINEYIFDCLCIKNGIIQVERLKI